MKVRLTQQIQGARDGRDWPEPGTELDLPDDEARALITGGSAVDPSEQRATVLVPPRGVHTPGRTAMPADATAPLVEAPVDAVSDPGAARRAAEAARDGNFVEGPAGIAHQQRSGLAHNQEGLDRAEQDERTSRETLVQASPKVGEATDQPAASEVAAQAAPNPQPTSATQSSQAQQDQARQAEQQRLEGLTVEQLRDEARAKGQSPSGSKAELVQRLSQQ